MKKRKKQGSTKPILFVPLTKVDVEKRLVYGTMAQGDIVDHADEIFDYDTSKPNFEKWSQDVEKASGGKSLGNVRAMHSNIAAGKLTSIDFNDDAKVISCVAKIVDDAEWAKVEEGVYTGFSIGGSYTKKWKDGDAMRYTADPVEVSIVDVPCIPTATFDLQRADGSVIKMAFKAAAAAKEFLPDNAAIAMRATEMATAIAASESWVDHIEAARQALIDEHAAKQADKENKKKEKEAAANAAADEAEEGFEAEDEANEESSDEGGNGDGGDDDADEDDADEDEESDEDKKKAAEKARDQVSQVWRTTDGRTFAKKTDAVPHQASLNASRAAGPLAKAIADAQRALAGEAAVDIPDVFADLGKAAKVVAFLEKRVGDSPMAVLQKGLYDVGWFARVIEDIACIQSCAASEADWEQDDSKVPLHLKENIQQLILTFIEMAMEESAELIARLKPEEVEEIVQGAKVTEGVGGSQEDDSDDPEVAVHAAEAVKFLRGNERLEKVGARNSKSDAEKLQKAHDALVELGVACKAVSTDDNAEESEAQKMHKMVETERDTLREENAKLQKQIEDSVPAIAKLTAEIKKLKDQPGPSAPRGSFAVDKVNDRAGSTAAAVTPATVEELLAKMTPDERTNLLIRVAQGQPQQLLDRGQR